MKKRSNKPYEQMTTLELLKSYLISKLPRGKQKLVQEQEEINSPPKDIPINYIAVVLDDNVEEVIRCENRLAALLLSNPIFVEFDPKKDYPVIGLTKYINEKFVGPEKENDLTEGKINQLLENLEKE
jgi:hypothetical protein